MIKLLAPIEDMKLLLSSPKGCFLRFLYYRHATRHFRRNALLRLECLGCLRHVAKMTSLKPPSNGFTPSKCNSWPFRLVLGAVVGIPFKPSKLMRSKFKYCMGKFTTILEIKVGETDVGT